MEEGRLPWTAEKMSTDSILKALNILFRHARLDIPYYVVAADELRGHVCYEKLPAVVIQNIDDGKGVHWIAYYVHNVNEFEYFDSYGIDLNIYYKVQRPRGRMVRENCTVLQSASSYVCGNYCILYVYSRAIGISYEQFLKQFNHSGRHNDNIVRRFVNNIPTMKSACKHACSTKLQSNTCKAKCPSLTRRWW